MERIAEHERELEDLDEEYRRKRAEIEQALAYLRAQVAHIAILTFTARVLVVATPPAPSNGPSVVRAIAITQSRSPSPGRMTLRGKRESGRLSSGWLSTRLAEMSAERSWIGDPQPPKEWHTRVVTHVKDRLEESETLQQQAQNNTLAQFSASPDLHSEFSRR